MRILLSTELSSYREQCSLPIANPKMILQNNLSLSLNLNMT